MIELLSSESVKASPGWGVSTWGSFVDLSGKPLTFPDGSRRGYLDFGCGFVFLENPHLERVSFDSLEPDIFGEDVIFPTDGSLYHKWTSIIHKKTSGLVLCASAYDLQGTVPDGYYSIAANDHRLHNTKFRPWPGTVAQAHYVQREYGVTNSAAIKRDCEWVAAAGMHAWPAGDGWYYVAMWGFMPGIYHRKDGLSFSPWSAVGTHEQVVTMRKWRYDGKVLHARNCLEGNQKFLIFVTDSPALMNGRAIEHAELMARSLTWDNEYIPRLGGVTTYARPTLRAPNYDAIFDSATRNPKWHQLAADAYQDLGFADINGIAYIKDSAEMGKQCLDFAKTLKSLPSSRVKGAASAWLAVHYGFKLALLDTKELVTVLQDQSLRNSRQSKCQASTNYITSRGVRYVARYQVFYNQYAKVQSLLEELQLQSDAVLTAENLWDMVPYSFIIDWFVNVGEVLTSLDNYASLTQNHDVICCGRSIKGEADLRPSQLGLDDRFYCNGAKVSYYARRYERTLLYPSFLPSVTVNPFNHLVEGAALVVSRK